MSFFFFLQNLGTDYYFQVYSGVDSYVDLNGDYDPTLYVKGFYYVSIVY